MLDIVVGFDVRVKRACRCRKCGKQQLEDDSIRLDTVNKYTRIELCSLSGHLAQEAYARQLEPPVGWSSNGLDFRGKRILWCDECTGG